MATHDYIISNASGAAVRADLNNALAAIASNNSSATEPTTTYAYQWWADTGSSPAVMKLRNAANSAWITLFQLDGEWTVVPFENGTAAAPSIYFKDSGTDTGIYSPGTDQVAITTGGTGRFFVDSSGRVGLGTGAPSQKLSVEDAADTYALVKRTVSGSESAILVGAESGKTVIYSRDNTTGGRALEFAIGTSPAARIDTSGRLLVGTSSGVGKLEAWTASNGDGLRLGYGNTPTGSAGPAVAFAQYNNASSMITTSSIRGVMTGGGVGTESGALFFETAATSAAPTERWRIDSSGSLIGVAGSAFVAPYIYNATTASAANVHVTSGGFLQRSTSSLKYKENVQVATHGLTELLQLRSVTYTGKSETDGSTVFGGLIAEEVDAVGLSEFVQYAEDGSPDALAYGNMVSLCIKAIQEQQAVIEELQAKVAALEAS